MTIDWKKYVDHIYIVDYINTSEEINKCFNKELTRIGINRYDSDFVTTFTNINTPLYQTLYNTFKLYTSDYSYAFDVTIGHYYCMKLAQAKNEQRILILENDCIFYDDVHIIEHILNQVKNGFNNNEIDLFCGNLGVMFDNAAEIDYNNTNIYKHTDYNIFCAGAAFNIYNPTAYNKFIKQIESSNYAIIDQYNNIYLYYNPEDYINMWFSHTMICVQTYWDLFMFNLYKHYNMIKPPIENIITHYNNISNNKFNGWIDNRNRIKILTECIEHFNLENACNEIYNKCISFLQQQGNNKKYL